MNLPPDEFILVQEERELAFLQACFVYSGTSKEHGAAISRLLVNSELRGVRSHGIGWAPGYCRKLKEGDLNPRPDICVVHETPTSVVIDGDGFLGYVPMLQATEMAIAKGKEVGIGMGMVRHIGHYGAAGHYGRICLEHDCVGFSVQGFRNDGNAGAREERPSVAFTSSPPMCFAIPGDKEPSIVLDMVAHAVSGYHQDSIDDLIERIPATFFKSMGLVAVATLLGGALTGFTLPQADELIQRWPGATMGGTVLAIDVKSVVPPEVFGAEVDRYIRDIRETTAPMPGYDEALLPGAVEERCMELHRREGIRFGDSEQKAARDLHEFTGVPLPWDE